MRMSKMHFHTLREVPNDAQVTSHVLMMRTGMIRKVTPGVFNYMPLGWRSIRKFEQIVREEMDAKGAQEINCTAMHPASLWEESGRWYKYGPELMRFQDRMGNDYCLGPTHEEIFTDIIRDVFPVIRCIF